MWRALVMWIAVGCVVPASETCPGDLRCPEGTHCRATQARELCVTDDQISACVDKLDGDSCSFGMPVQSGGCVEGACLLPHCGNGIREVGEACDDANDVIGDGCSIECRSDETCGNGYADALRLIGTQTAPNEQCDDGNRIASDGCSNACRIESPAWFGISQGTPPGRVQSAMAYDVVRRRVVMFGGGSPGDFPYDDLWEWDGFSWTSVPMTARPPARSDHAMAYDADAHELVVFGGLTIGAVLGDTWVWNGATWELADGVGPSRRIGARMAFDARRGRIVLFGGEVSLGLLAGGGGPLMFDQTWEWHDRTWTQICETGCGATPPPRSHAAFGYDPERGVIVMFGGASGQSLLADTWELDGTTWRDVSPAFSPPASRDSNLTWDSVNHRMLLSGGESAGFQHELYTWDGQTWRLLSEVTASSLDGHAMAFDPVLGRAVAFSLGNTWEWDGTQFTYDPPRYAPPSTYTAKVATAVELQRTLLVTNGRTWEYEGATFRERFPVTQPSLRAEHAIAYDRAQHRSVLFGGTMSSATLLGDTWLWDSVAGEWTSGAPAAPRYGHALEWDGQRVILFGGHVTTGFTADTLAWTGSAWTSLAPTVSPPARRYHAMAFDPLRQRVVMFGGDPGGSALLHDTWEWDGATWTEIATPQTPPGRMRAAMTWDPSRRRIVMYGGRGATLLGDAWEYDGATWTALQTLTRPAPRAAAVLFPLSHGVLMFGGDSSAGGSLPQGLNDSARLRWEGFEREEACLADLEVDLDRDGQQGCSDVDCWQRCTPSCMPGSPATCAQTTPRCGDQTCAANETCTSCPGDCTTCAAVCGDFTCSAAETCPGDCL